MVRALALLAVWGISTPGWAATYVVDSAADAGTGTLRAALTAAAATPEQDVIEFAILGDGPHFIVLQTALPASGTGGVVLDGFTQPGSVAPTETAPADLRVAIVANPSHESEFPELEEAPALYLTGVSVLRGVIIANAPGSGVFFSGQSLVVEGVAIGTTPDGFGALRNGECGIQIGTPSGLHTGHTVTIGGSTAATRNIIAGNGAPGVCIASAETVVVQNTLIGVREDRITTLPNEGGVFAIDVGSLSLLAGTQVVGAHFPALMVQAAETVTVTDALIGARADGSVLLQAGVVDVDADVITVTGSTLGGYGMALVATEALTWERNDARSGAGAHQPATFFGPGTVAIRDSAFQGFPEVTIDVAGAVVFERNTVEGTAQFDLSSPADIVVRDTLLDALLGLGLDAGGDLVLEGTSAVVTGEITVVAGGSATLTGNDLAGGDEIDLWPLNVEAPLGVAFEGNQIAKLSVAVGVSAPIESTFSDNAFDDARLDVEAAGGVTIAGNTGSVRRVTAFAPGIEFSDNTLEHVGGVTLVADEIVEAAGNALLGTGDPVVMASPEGAVRVEGGSYLGVPTNLASEGTVLASGATFAVLNANDSTEYGSVSLTDVHLAEIHAMADDVTLSGITCAGTCSFEALAGHDLVAEGLTFSHVEEPGNGKRDAHLWGLAGSVSIEGASLAGFNYVSVQTGGEVALRDVDIGAAGGMLVDAAGDVTLDGCQIDAVNGVVSVKTSGDFDMTGSTVGRLGGSVTSPHGDAVAFLASALGDVDVSGNTFEGVRGGIGLYAQGDAQFSDNAVSGLAGGMNPAVLVIYATSDILAEGDSVSGAEAIGMESEGGDVTVRDAQIDSVGAMLHLSAPTGTLEVTDSVLAVGNTLPDHGQGEQTPTLDGKDINFERNAWTLAGTVVVDAADALEFHDNVVRPAFGDAALEARALDHTHLTGNDIDGLQWVGCGGRSLLFHDNRLVAADVAGSFDIEAELVWMEGNHFANADAHVSMGAARTFRLIGNTFEDLGQYDGVRAERATIVGNTFTRVAARHGDVPPESDDPLHAWAVHFEGTDEITFEGNTVVDALHPVRIVGEAVTLDGNTFDGGQGVGAWSRTTLDVVDNIVRGQESGFLSDGASAALLLRPWEHPDDGNPDIDCTIVDNVIEANSRAGLLAACDASADVRGNSFRANSSVGALVSSAVVAFDDNVVEGNRGPGAMLGGEGSLEVLDNSVRGNLGLGLALFNGGSTSAAPVHGNTVQDNGRAGILVLGRVDLAGNTFGGNGGLAVDHASSGSQIDLLMSASTVTPNAPSATPPCRGLGVGSFATIAPTAWPTVEQATFDDQGRLVLEGTGCPGARVDLYQARPDAGEPTWGGRAHGEGVALLGTVTPAAVTGAFTLTVADVAFLSEGPTFVTGMATTLEWGSSEFGPNRPLPSCGDGGLDLHEACDDANNAAGDGCAPACAVEHGWSCTAGPDRTCTATCGDGLLATGHEACDDDDLEAGDGCSADCTLEIGFVCAADPQTVPESACVAVCGDSRLLGDETCDDGNAVGGDGCSAACLRQPVTRVLTGPNDPTSALTATFTFTDANGAATAFECSEDGGATWTACNRATDTAEVFAYDWAGALSSGQRYVLLVRGVAEGVTDEVPALWEWSIEVDPDGDGLSVDVDNCPDDANADQADLDRDGHGDVCDDDVDGDGLSNTLEDFNGDGVLDGRETDPVLPDTDGDGLCDGWSDVPVLDAGGGVACNAGEDANVDGATSDDETDPTVADTDGDCMSDGDEVLVVGSDPLDARSPTVVETCEVERRCGCATPTPAAFWLFPLVAAFARRRRA